MSISQPQNREELKSYIKTKLGAPVIQINVADEQMDLAIDDAFQYFIDRQHYEAVERVYLTVKVTPAFRQFLRTGKQIDVAQTNEPGVSASGIVSTLQLVTPGDSYPLTDGVGAPLYAVATSGGTGEKLTVNVDAGRTVSGGLLSVSVADGGSGYQVGDQIEISGSDGGTPAVFQVDTITTSSPLFSEASFSEQNNFIVLPEGVNGVSRILKKSGALATGGIVPGAAFFNPFLMGMGGGMGAASQVGGMNFDLTSYYSMQQYLATLDFMVYPPLSYNYHRQTRRLHINSDTLNGIETGDFLVFEVDMVASPEIFPEMWNQRFFKELSTAYVQLAWGRVLTKYQQVQLPGGITMNGDAIKEEAQQTIQDLKERFNWDYADPVLDIVG